MSHLFRIEDIDQKVIDDPDWHLEMARGFTAANKWIEAAHHYDKYLI